MRALLPLCFLAAACGPAFAQPIGACDDPNNTDPNSCTAFFEFAPQSGQGMGSACACTNPTGAKGEALTFTRASSGTCLKGNTTTGIANGDMVTCTANQPRVMPGGDGTGGSGLLVEGARTNSALRSEEFDNAAWTKGNSGSSAPTVTANQAVAPDGTTTADRVQIPATTGAERNFVIQTGFANGFASASIFFRGNGTSGTLDFGMHDGTVYVCAVCSYNATTWTRCNVNNVTSATTARIIFGNLSDAPTCNTGAHGAADVFAWGGQWELGAFPSSYIATAGAAVTRAAEDAYFAVTPSTYLTGSVAATVVQSQTTDSVVSGAGVIALQDTGSYTDLLYTNSTTQVTMIAGGSGATATHNLASSPRRFAGWWNASNVAVIGATQTTAAAGTYATFNRLYLGAFNASGYNFAVLKRVCWDAADTRCR